MIAGNYIGTDASGKNPSAISGRALTSARQRVRAAASASMIEPRIPRRAQRGLGQRQRREPGGCAEAVIAGNLIGTDKDGLSITGASQGAGITLFDSSSITIGGTGVLANIIAFNGSDGVGLGAGNTGNAILGNSIHHNGLSGVAVVQDSTGTAVQGNSIHDNGGLGIDLLGDGVTPNDSHAGQPGPNHWQNFPVLSAAYGGSTTYVVGTLHSTPDTTFMLDFYSNPVADSSGYGEGQSYLGSAVVTTDASGSVSFQASGLAAAALGQWITATATAPDGSTSEFSAGRGGVQGPDDDRHGRLDGLSALRRRRGDLHRRGGLAHRGPGMPTGTVQFAVDGVDVGAPIPLVVGVAGFSTSYLAVGSHTVSARYSGNDDIPAQRSGVDDRQRHPARQPLRHRLRRLQRRRPGRLRRAGHRRRHDHPDRHRRPRQRRQPQPDDRRRRRLRLPEPAAGHVHDHRDPAGRLHAGDQQRRHRRRDRLAATSSTVRPGGGPRRPELQLRRAAGRHRGRPARPDGRHRLLEQQERPGADQGPQRRRPAPSSATGWRRPSPTCSARPSGSNNLAGKSNADVASFFQSRFVVKGQKLDAQVLATALAVYVTDATLDSTGVGTQYGFIVGGNGVATATFNVGSNGAAFGVADNTAMTVMDLLLAADAQAVNGVLYNGNTTKRNKANNVFSAINQAGGI